LLDYKVNYSDSYALKSTTALILGYAVSRVFPGAKLLGSSVDETGFSYRFNFKDFSPTFFEAIELEMKKIIKEDLLIETKSMVFQPAKGYLEHLGLQRQLNIHEDEYTFVEFGDFVDLSCDIQLESTGKASHFFLTNFLKQEDGFLEIFGNSFFEKDELKAYKKIKPSPDRFTENNLLNADGIEALLMLQSSWNQGLKKSGFTLFQNLSLDQMEIEEKNSETRQVFIEEEKPLGLLRSEVKTQNITYIEDKDLFSYLKNLFQWLNILGLDHFSCFCNLSKKNNMSDLQEVLDSLGIDFEKRVNGQRISLTIFIEDELKRPWKVFELKTRARLWEATIVSFERVLGLLREKGIFFLKDKLAQIDMVKL